LILRYIRDSVATGDKPDVARSHRAVVVLVAAAPPCGNHLQCRAQTSPGSVGPVSAWSFLSPPRTVFGVWQVPHSIDNGFRRNPNSNLSALAAGVAQVVSQLFYQRQRNRTGIKGGRWLIVPRAALVLIGGIGRLRRRWDKWGKLDWWFKSAGCDFSTGAVHRIETCTWRSLRR